MKSTLVPPTLLPEKIRALFTGTVLSLAAAMSATLPSAAVSPANIQGAEDNMRMACLEKNSPKECQCVLDGLKNELPPEYYQAMIGLVAGLMNDDITGITGLWDFFVTHDLKLSELERIAKELERVGGVIEKKCDGANLSLELDA